MLSADDFPGDYAVLAKQAVSFLATLGGPTRAGDVVRFGQAIAEWVVTSKAAGGSVQDVSAPTNRFFHGLLHKGVPVGAAFSRVFADGSVRVVAVEGKRLTKHVFTAVREHHDKTGLIRLLSIPWMDQHLLWISGETETLVLLGDRLNVISMEAFNIIIRSA